MLKSIVQQAREDLQSLVPTDPPPPRAFPGLSRRIEYQGTGAWTPVDLLDTPCPAAYRATPSNRSAQLRRAAAWLLGGAASPVAGLLAARRASGHRGHPIMEALATLVVSTAACLWAAGHRQETQCLRACNGAGIRAAQQGTQGGATLYSPPTLDPTGSEMDLMDTDNTECAIESVAFTQWRAPIASLERTHHDAPIVDLHHYREAAMSVATLVQGADTEASLLVSNELPVQLREALRALAAPRDTAQVRAAIEHACQLHWLAQLPGVPTPQVTHAALHATAVVFYDGRMVVAHAGNGRALLCDRAGTTRLTVDHRPTNTLDDNLDFALRDEDTTHALLLRQPLAGMQAPGVEVTFVPATQDPRACVVLMSRAVAQVLSDNQVNEALRKQTEKPGTQVAESLLKAACARGATGNLKVMLLPVAAAMQQDYSTVAQERDFQLPKASRTQRALR